MVHLPTALFSLSYIRDSSNRCSHYAPLRGATVVTRTVTEGAAEFQSTRPLRGATKSFCRTPLWRTYFNPRAPRGARRYRLRMDKGDLDDFNPRAPRGARPVIFEFPVPLRYFNPRAPRGARLTFAMAMCRRKKFQSTRPARGATRCQPTYIRHLLYFNPRAPRGARRSGARDAPDRHFISIHAPREGRDVPPRASRS